MCYIYCTNSCFILLSQNVGLVLIFFFYNCENIKWEIQCFLSHIWIQYFAFLILILQFITWFKLRVHPFEFFSPSCETK